MLKRAAQVAEIIQKAASVHIVTHIDADGITAGAIASASLQRLGKEYSIEAVKQLDDEILLSLEAQNYDLVWFTDLGSSISSSWKHPKVITDHHECPDQANHPFHLNPHLFDIDGGVDISGAGVTYLVAKALDAKNIDLAGLAIVGAVGDLQDRKHSGVHGINRKILADGESAGVLQANIDARFFGKETRPLVKLLRYANDPCLPGLSGREEACSQFLKNLGISLVLNEHKKRWVDLEHHEKQLILSELAQEMIAKGYGAKNIWNILGESYTLLQEKPGSELHDAKEFATLLNATARYNKADIGLQVCLGNRKEALEEARQLLLGHRQNIVEALQFAREENIHKKTMLQYFHAQDGIRDTIVGIVTNMLLHSEEVDSSLPLIGFAHTDNGKVKVSARTTQALVSKGVNLSMALKKAARNLQGVGGGHMIAAGATIPKGTEEKFLELLEKELKDQLS